MSKINTTIINILKETASRSPVTYRVSAIAFDKKGNILGRSVSSISTSVSLENYRNMCLTGKGRPGVGVHAERKLMSRYKGLIKTIVICRIGNRGDLLPIKPCDCCSRIANKLGIRIISVEKGSV